MNIPSTKVHMVNMGPAGPDRPQQIKPHFKVSSASAFHPFLPPPCPTAGISQKILKKTTSKVRWKVTEGSLPGPQHTVVLVYREMGNTAKYFYCISK